MFLRRICVLSMAHLSTCVFFLSHARLKANQCSVGGSSPSALIKTAGDYYVWAGVGDQIEMIQYIRGRIGEDRSTILDMGRVPDHYGTGPSAPLAGQKRAPDSPGYSPVTSEDDEPAEPALRRPKGDNTATDSRSAFSPMTGSDQYPPASGIKTEAQAGDICMIWTWPRSQRGSAPRQSSSTMTDSQSFTPLTGSDQHSPVTEGESDAQAGERHVGAKNETQACDMDLAKIASGRRNCFSVLDEAYLIDERSRRWRYKHRPRAPAAMHTVPQALQEVGW
jgi:hypothetical protein